MVQRGAIAMIEAYQRAFAGRPSPCRFFPSCSTYAHEAFGRHGTVGGGWLTLRRLARCRPLGPSGFDPVPDSCSRRCRHVEAELEAELENATDAENPAAAPAATDAENPAATTAEKGT